MVSSRHVCECCRVKKYTATPMTTTHNDPLGCRDLDHSDKPLFSAPRAHASTINAIDGCGGLGIGHGSPELVTGSQDGHVRVWDPRVPEAVLTLEPTASVHQNGVGAGAGGVRDCWTVAFGNSFDDTERCIAAGYDNGDIKLFDLRTSRMRWEDNAGNGVVSLEFDRCGGGTGVENLGTEVQGPVVRVSKYTYTYSLQECTPDVMASAACVYLALQA